jgi:hypothetical protein
MTKTRYISIGALALVAAVHAPLSAQGSSQQVQLAFGYECGDRFLVRNDGSSPVVVEYAVAGSSDKSTLHLNGRQSAEIASAQSGNVELWVGGKVVASEPKGNRACGAPRNGNGGGNSNNVSVRPINPNESTATLPADSAYTEEKVVVYGSPYDGYYPYGYAYGYAPYGYYGYSPFFYPSVSIYSRGGFGGGFGRGFGGRGRGRR